MARFTRKGLCNLQTGDEPLWGNINPAVDWLGFEFRDLHIGFLNREIPDYPSVDGSNLEEREVTL